ncbi:hypothetical protein [Nocardioides sp. SR21]|uniref:hypothetical protein n=1 Tax=Nocardioides sp. SR21 TaxID=2919501 RepID=UPI001FA9EE04|nr:hypothetical protein [Nocardioides sp. SR21]
MTARNRSRTWFIGAGIAALLAPLALVVAVATPASALPGKPHEVYIYKVEKHVDMSGEYPEQFMHEHLACNNGDYALDGMWRVDHVDQAQPPHMLGDERDVYFTASYGDPGDPKYWHFRAYNRADGDAQIKLFLTCIRGTVEQAFNHTHGIQVSPSLVDTSRTNLQQDFDSGVPAWTPNNDWDHNQQCQPGELAIAPGFNFTRFGSGYDGHKARLFRSYPTANYQGWHWAFLVEEAPNNVDVTLYLRCLRIKTAPAGNGPHAHNLQWAWRPNGQVGFHDFFGGAQVVQEKRLNCDDGPNSAFFQDYKLAVASFYITRPFHTWFLGMDPRPKQRAFKFWWDGNSAFNSHEYYLGGLCIRARTGKQVAP